MKTLALRARPKKLKELVGQNYIRGVLAGIFKNMEIPNAFFLMGASGTGKTTTARLISRYINCKKGTSCGKCDSCHQHDQGVYRGYEELDSSELDKASMKRVLERAKLAPPDKIRVIVFDEAHKMSHWVSNLLLKPLEEPPSKTLFIVATNMPENIPNSSAVVGRCFQLPLEQPTRLEIGNRLTELAKQEGMKYLTPALCQTIAESSGGQVRDAIQSLETVHFFIKGLKKIPTGKKLKVLIEKKAIKNVDHQIGVGAATALLGVYGGSETSYIKALLDNPEHIPLVNKMLALNQHFINHRAVGKHERIYNSSQNFGFIQMMKKKKVKVKVRDLMEIQLVLADVRAKLVSSGVDSMSLMMEVFLV